MRLVILLALLLSACASNKTDNDAKYWGAASRTIGNKIGRQ